MDTRFPHACVLNVMSDDHPGIIAAASQAIEALSGNMALPTPRSAEGRAASGEGKKQERPPRPASPFPPRASLFTPPLAPGTPHLPLATRHSPLATRPSALFLLYVCAVVLFTGCGSKEYELHVRLPAGTVVRRDAKVFLDSIEAGKITGVGRAEGAIVATVVIGDRSLASARIRPGIVATVRRDRGIDLDSREIDRRAAPLPSGTTIEGTTKFDLLVRRYARWQTVAVFGVGVLGLLVVFWVFRAFFKIGWVVIALGLAAGAASLLYRPLTPLVERAYGSAEEDTTPSPESGAPAPPATGTPSLDIPRPSPRAVAFFAAWLASFVVLQCLVGAALRATRRR